MGIDDFKSVGKKMQRTWRKLEEERIKQTKPLTKKQQKRLEDNISWILKQR